MALLRYLCRMFVLPTSSILSLFSLPAAFPLLNLTTHQKTWKGVWLGNDSELSKSLFGQIQRDAGRGLENSSALAKRMPLPHAEAQRIRSAPGVFWSKSLRELAATLQIWWQQIRGTEDNPCPHSWDSWEALTQLPHGFRVLISACKLNSGSMCLWGTWVTVQWMLN